ncbi:MAG: radical SAM protein [Candidatus Lokiarchaeota archaeon]|nr:radical SAM protein [Candidatus Lokiarchaeota archaeon]
MDKKDKCEICGNDLVYSTKIGYVQNMQCYYCSEEFSTDTWCPSGHYICDKCHSRDPISIIQSFCTTTDLKDPFEIADEIMKHDKFKVYGPEHHVLAPLAILTSLKNNSIKKPDGSYITNDDLLEAIRRASKIPGGWCGFYGSCGAGMGSGIAISIFTGATPARNQPRSLANLMTSRSLSKIADNLEHCCKRSVRISIMESLEFLREHFNINLNYKPKTCVFSNKNDKCEKANCFLFNLND